jgi:chemotaxis protein methyltransferase CheR
MVTVAPTLSEADFQRFSDLLRARSGMEFSGQRRADLERALEQAFNEFGVPTPELLYDRLTGGLAAPVALEAFIASLTVPETYFFRNQPQFEALEQRILPELIERRRDLRRLRIWSVGCASGEEPYSLAMLLRRVLPDLAAWDVKILATDLNRGLLEKAERGLYTAWSFRDTPPDIQAQYFTRRGGQFELSPQVRGQVTFAFLNLADDSYPSALTDTLDMDLILFRNVLIYFGEEMARRVIDRLYDALADGGWLLVGHAEPSISLFNRFITHSFPSAIVYQKQVGAPAACDTPVEARPRPAVTRRGSSHARGPGTSSGSHTPRPAARPYEPVRRAASVPAPKVAVPPATGGGDLLSQYQAAKWLADQSQLEPAHHSILALVQEAPLFAPAYYLQGLILQELGDAEGALAALRRCVYVDAGFVMGHLALANLYTFAGQADRAQRYRENITRLLAGAPAGDPIPEGDGMTVGDLRRTVGAAQGA